MNKNILNATALGDIDFFSNKPIVLQLDHGSNEVVYAIKIINPKGSIGDENEVIYIGETLDFSSRKTTHINKIKNEDYKHICKYITPTMECDIDFEIIKLASAPLNYTLDEKKRYLSHAECIYIEKYNTTVKGNHNSLTGDCSHVYKWNFRTLIKNYNIT